MLLTDGEETCDGDPAAEIEKLQKSGLGMRVSIVGFAIDEPNLAVTFRQWAKAGNGAFFQANDAAGLSNALAQAMRPGFEVVDAKGQVVAEGVAGVDTVKVMPGNYTVASKARKAPPKPVTVKQKETLDGGLLSPCSRERTGDRRAPAALERRGGNGSGSGSSPCRACSTRWTSRCSTLRSRISRRT